MEYYSIGYRPFPATLDVKKLLIEVAYSKGTGGEGTTVITQGISIWGRNIHIEVGAINGSKGIFERWEKLAVIEDIIGYGVADFGWSDLTGVEWVIQEPTSPP